ncbi:Clavaminate synthase-like protein [Phellopilus nigrolimitatus]|nr:Clavaminate synthase-like protein [Phellopilus nigrolimitatus]
MDEDDDLKTFSLDVLAEIDAELCDQSNEISLHLSPCGKENTTRLLSAARRQSSDYARMLEEISKMAHEMMKETQVAPKSLLAWRRLYSEVALVWAMLDCLVEQQTSQTLTRDYWKNAIARLDHAIVVAGAPGQGKLDLILECIEQIQKAHLPLQQGLMPRVTCDIHECTSHFNLSATTLLPSARREVPSLPYAPSMTTFSSTLRHAPFILRRFANEWPAVCEGRWSSRDYLQRIAGIGRVVPLEVGRDYRRDDWVQCMMGWDDFLAYLFPGDHSRSQERSEEIIYLAQHDLFKQFPTLRNDILVPDYVYAALPPPETYPQYFPPVNDDSLVLNTWLGPKGTVSPAHTDPYFNLYVQVVGRKTVWLAPPHVSHALSPYSEPAAHDSIPPPGCPSDQKRSKADSDAMLGNTSRLDVFSDAPGAIGETKMFKEQVMPAAMCATLEAGDMLFFPPGWWHAMRSESLSFSVSMWF